MRRYLMISCVTVLFSSCVSDKKEVSTSQKDTLSVNRPAKVVVADSTSAETWIEDFRDFRQALYDKNTAKLKTYFEFPLKDEGGALWERCALTDVERKQRTAETENTDLFYEKDFDRYYQRIFDQKFLNCVLKLKSDKIFRGAIDETKEFPDQSHPYSMHGGFDQESQTLQLNMAFRNNEKDENGNYVSEGEYNIIYFFEVVDGKKLRFKKIVIAG